MTPEAELLEPELSEEPAKRVSVIIVSFNRANSLRDSLTALGAAHQVLVVDNGSTDGTAALQEEFPAARFIRLPKNFGLTKALNIGLRAAEGSYILLLHDDIRITGAGVSELADFLESRQDVEAVCPVLVNASGERASQVRPLPTTASPDSELTAAAGSREINAECVVGAAILFRTYYLRALRHIDERYGNYGSDIELCAQVKRSSRKLIVLSDVPALHLGSVSPMKKGALAGDRVAGTAAFLGKHSGFIPGMLYRIKMGLIGLVTFRFSVVGGALGGMKIDGA